MRRAADLMRLGILCSAVGWLLAGDHSAAVKALLVLPPALLGRLVAVHPAFDLLFASALAAEATATSLGAYDTIGWGDTLSHLVLPFLSAPILYAAVTGRGGAARRGAPNARFLAGAAVITAGSVLAVGVVWELVEWAADGVFGTDFSQGRADTLQDLLNDGLAATAGGVAVAGWLWASSPRPRARSGPPRETTTWKARSEPSGDQ